MELRLHSRGPAVEFAVLGCLVEAPVHGYELRERLAKGVGSFWRIASSQLYQVLHRLNDEGWIERVATAGSGRQARAVYRVTDKGRSAFWRWATSPVRHPRQVRMEFLAKIYFLRRLAPNRVPRLLEDQALVLRVLSRRLAARPRLELDDEAVGELAVSYRRTQVEGMIHWLEESRRKILAGGRNPCEGPREHPF